MIDFDECDLLTLAEKVGFTEIHLELNVEIKPHHAPNWDGIF
jgi:hypothetical protein